MSSAAATPRGSAMTMSPVDRSAHLNRWRRRPLAEKSLLALGMLVLAVSLPPFPAAVMIAAGMTVAALAGARVPARVWLGCASAPVGFMLTGAVVLVVQFDGRGFSLSPAGLAAAGGLIARSLAGLSCLLFLALTTPATDLMAGLRRIGVPAEIVEIALLMYRFIFLIADEAFAMNAAQAARLGHATRWRRLRSLGLLLASLLPRALDRARRLETGLAARGWQGEMRVLADRPALSWPILGLIAAAEGLTVAAGVWL
jgi:cobalt/nickel transport system permease protein